MFIKIKQTKDKAGIIGAIYRPPGTDPDIFNQELDSLLAHLSRTCSRAFLAGDFNLDLLKIDNHRPTRAFFNTLNSYHFMPSIVRPTRITSDSATLIDNIFTNEITYSLESAIIINDKSDHLPVILQCSLAQPKVDQSLTYANRTINDQAKAKFSASLKSAQWDTVIDACNHNDPSMAYTLFIDKYKHLYDTAFPIVHCTTNKRHVYKQPWMSKYHAT